MKRVVHRDRGRIGFEPSDAVEQRVEEGLHLEPREARARTRVPPVAECEMVSCISRDIKGIRTRIASGIPVGAAVAGNDALTGLSLIHI